MKLIFDCVGLANVTKVLKRQRQVNHLRRKGPVCYLWYLGVHPTHQGKGTGSRLLKEIINECQNHNQLICLETSTKANLPWYKKFGFTVYNELDLGYTLYFLKQEPFIIVPS